jgi:mono/diheme cytochrome c family protein
MYFKGRVALMSFAVVTMLIVLTHLLAGCDYARMKDQESVRTFESEMPEAVEGTIPINGGIAILKSENPSKIRNPLSTTPETIERGRTAYGYFCVMCHGPKLDGNGTVGQSFFPLPADLVSPYVLQQNDGELFCKISLGYKRHPPLAHTVAVEDRWAVITYIRSQAKGSKG